MDKLSILKSLSNDEKYFTWVKTGSLEANEKTSYFCKGMLYKLTDLERFSDKEIYRDTYTTEEGDEIEMPEVGAIVYCKEEYVGTPDWGNACLEDYDNGYITFKEDIISPNFVLILTAMEVYESSSAIVPATFLPYSSAKDTRGDSVNIEESDYTRILSVVGYPFITEEELEYTREQITDLAIKPALEEYFHWLPKAYIQTETLVTSKETEIEAPTGAYDVLHYSVQQGGTSVGTGFVTNTILRSFYDGMYGVMNTANLTGSFYGNTSPKTSSGSTGNYLVSRAATQGMINYSNRNHLDKYTNADGKLCIRIYSLKGGVAEIHWAMRTYDFNDVEFAQRNNVIEYAQANVKLLFANLRKQARGDIPGNYDYSSWVSEAEATKKDILTEWKALVKASGVIRGSL